MSISDSMSCTHSFFVKQDDINTGLLVAKEAIGSTDSFADTKKPLWGTSLANLAALDI